MVDESEHTQKKNIWNKLSKLQQSNARKKHQFNGPNCKHWNKTWTVMMTILLFVCELLGYVSRAVRPSVSWSYTKRTIQNREKKQKNQFQWSDQRKTNSSNKFENKLASAPRSSESKTRRPFRSQVIHRRCTRSRRGIGAERHWARASDMKKGGTDDRNINNDQKLAEMSGETRIT